MSGVGDTFPVVRIGYGRVSTRDQFFHILGAIAEFEHALMSERTMDGLAAVLRRARCAGAFRCVLRSRARSLLLRMAVLSDPGKGTWGNAI